MLFSAEKKSINCKNNRQKWGHFRETNKIFYGGLIEYAYEKWGENGPRKSTKSIALCSSVQRKIKKSNIVKYSNTQMCKYY